MTEESEIVNNDRYKSRREFRSQNWSLYWTKRCVGMASFASKSNKKEGHGVAWEENLEVIAVVWIGQKNRPHGYFCNIFFLKIAAFAFK